MSDSQRFNGFVKEKLAKELRDDVLRFYVFNESDLHSAAYCYIRRYFESRGSELSQDVFVRCEPYLADNTKPDIVVFQKYDPIYVIELKMSTKAFKTPGSVFEEKVDKDMDKLKAYRTAYPTVRWAFLIVVCDSEKPWGWSDVTTKRYGYDKTSLVSVNLHLRDNGGQTYGYENWRKQFEKYLDKHG